MIRIGIVGFGVVGQGFVELLISKKNEISKMIGDFKVEFIADSKSSISGNFELDEALKLKKMTGRLKDDKKPQELVEDAEYDVLVECSVTKLDGGDALKYIKTALKKGSHVVTSNKGPLVAEFEELMKIAERNNVKLMYEATVGAAIPVIRVAKGYLKTFTIKSVSGILNGTCNYILSRMEEEGLDFNQVLSEAVELGIAEADASYDIEGIDAAIKLVILANTVGIKAKFDEVYRKGISYITPEAFRIANEKDYTIRLVAEASKDKLSVAPRLVKKSHPLSIKGTMNVVVFKTEEAGELYLAGRGAGKYETASAMMSDMVHIYAPS